MTQLAGVVGAVFVIVFLLSGVGALADAVVGQIGAPAVFVAIGLAGFLLAWLDAILENG